MFITFFSKTTAEADESAPIFLGFWWRHCLVHYLKTKNIDI